MIVGLVIAAVVGAAAATATAGAGDDPWSKIRDHGDGIDAGYSQEQAQALAEDFPPGASVDRPFSWYEYSAVIDCPTNSPAQPRLEVCGSAVEFCETYAPGSPGPYAIIFRRTVVGAGGASIWSVLAPTCFAPDVPSHSGAPTDLTDDGT